MEVSALKYSGGIGLHGRPALLRLQSDERLIAFLRKGNTAAFEVLFSRYEARLMAFCRHLLGSREDAEDVLQEVMAAAFNAIVADERAINVRPWLYRIARNRSLNHLRRARAIASDTMDAHFSDHGASTADKVHDREEFRLLVGDIHELPETQKTALVLREMDALSYEQIAEAMEATVPSVKSLLVRARVSLAEAAEARLLSCDEVRIELGEMAEGLRRRPTPLVRRHLRSCDRCTIFRRQLRHTNKALAALMPIGPLVVLKNLAIFHLGHSAGSGATAASHTAAAGAAGASGAGAAGAAGAGGSALAGSGVAASGGFLSAGLGALAGKAAAGFAAAAIVSAGAVEAGGTNAHPHQHPTTIAAVTPAAPAAQATVTPIASAPERRSTEAVRVRPRVPLAAGPAKAKTEARTKTKAGATANTGKPAQAKGAPKPTATVDTPARAKVAPAGRSQTTTDPTVLKPAAGSSAPAPTPASAPPSAPSSSPAQPASPAPSTSPTTTSPAPTTSTSTSTTSTTPAPTNTTTTPSPTTTTGTTPAPAATSSTTTPAPTSSSSRADGPARPLSISIGGPSS